MSKLRAIIADDERPAREFLKGLLRELDVELVGEAENGADAIEAILAFGPDIAFLDLQMPEVSGMEVVRRLPADQMPMIAFVTAFDEYAVQAFEVNAVDYLLKPVERSRLAKTIERTARRVEETGWRTAEDKKVKNAIIDYDEASRSRPLDRVPVRKGDDILLLAADDIASITADAELLHITTKKNEKFTINYRLKDIESRLDENKFIRLSRSVLVAVDTIGKISPMPGGTYLVSLTNGQELSSSRIQSRILRDRFLKL